MFWQGEQTLVKSEVVLLKMKQKGDSLSSSNLYQISFIHVVVFSPRMNSSASETVLKIFTGLKNDEFSGCFCSTVHKMSNKVHASIIKHASHGSRTWIKASCSESMRFCKKNIHISNVINTFPSLHLTVIRGSRSGGWRRTSALRD